MENKEQTRRDAKAYITAEAERVDDAYSEAARIMDALLAELEQAEVDVKAITASRDYLAERCEQAERLLLDIEGTIIAYWTDIPEVEVEKLRLRIREVLNES